MSENQINAEPTPVAEKKGLDPRIAFALMVVMIVCAFLIGANKAWKKNRAGLDASYMAWQENTQQRVETAYNLLTVAGRYYAQDDPQIAAVRKELTVMENTAGDLAARVNAASNFLRDGKQLLTDLAEKTQAAGDKRDTWYATQMLPQMLDQCGSDAALADYNIAVMEYNGGLHSFSGWLARLTGVKYASYAEIAADHAEQ